VLLLLWLMRVFHLLTFASVYVCVLQLSVHFLRMCSTIGARYSKLWNDTASLTKAPLTPAAVADIPEGVVEELKAASVVAIMRNDAVVAAAKAAKVGTSSAPCPHRVAVSVRLSSLLRSRLPAWRTLHRRASSSSSSSSSSSLCAVACAESPRPALAKDPAADAVSAHSLLWYLIGLERACRVLPVDVTCEDMPALHVTASATAARLTAVLAAACPPFAADVMIAADTARVPAAEVAVPDVTVVSRWCVDDVPGGVAAEAKDAEDSETATMVFLCGACAGDVRFEEVVLQKVRRRPRSCTCICVHVCVCLWQRCAGSLFVTRECSRRVAAGDDADLRNRQLEPSLREHSRSHGGAVAS
jgi:hypothetical protein